jgi:hypothetical protein
MVILIDPMVIEYAVTIVTDYLCDIALPFTKLMMKLVLLIVL